MVIELNLMTLNGMALRPSRTWRKNTGPGELSLTPTATTRSNGDIARRTAELMHRSNARFTNLSHAVRWGWAISRNGVPEKSVRERQLINS